MFKLIRFELTLINNTEDDSKKATKYIQMGKEQVKVFQIEQKNLSLFWGFCSLRGL